MRVRNNLRKLGLARWHVKCALYYGAAYLWRRVLWRTTFIGITGSVGKTTAKECLAAILSSHFATAKTVANQNDFSGVPLSILGVRPWHRFAVLEVAASEPGLVRRSARLLRPDIAVVLAVARAHTKSLRTLDNIAAEKAELLAALPARGIAVLNGDDPRVAAMEVPTGRRMVLFGSDPSFEYRADNVSSRWPERLSFDLHAGRERRRVRAQLVGAHWKTSVLAAIATSQVCQMELEAAVEAVALVEPTPGRMQPVSLPCGAVVIRDDFNGSIATLGCAIDVLRNAHAERKILVMSDVIDSPLSPRDRMARIGKEVAGFVHSVIFLGRGADHGVRGAIAGGMPPERVHGFVNWQQAAEFMKPRLAPGDLVLLRAGRFSEHLDRLYFALCGSVACQKATCEKRILCDLCPELGAQPLIQLTSACVN